MEFLRSFESPKEEFDIDTERDVEYRDVPVNPEAFPGCVVGAMLASNRGINGAREAVMSTVVDECGNDLAMACGRCGITLVRDSGTVYGASRCPEITYLAELT